MHYYGSNDEAKENARKKRRLDTKPEIENQLDDTSKMSSSTNNHFDPYAAIQDILKDKSVYDLDMNDRLAAIAKYPSWKQHTYLVLLSEGLIMNGGTPALFYNDGCIAPSVATAYAAVGAMKHAAWIRNLMSLFGDTYPMDIDRINDLIIETPEQPWDTSSDFFFNFENSTEIDKLLEQVFHTAHFE